MYRVVAYAVIIASVIASASFAQSADPDLPDAPQPGLPWLGPVCPDGPCIHDWGNAIRIFFQQKRCVSLLGTPVDLVSPFDYPNCPRLAYLDPDVRLPYHKRDANHHWSDEVPVLLPSGEMISAGLQCSQMQCSNPNIKDNVTNTAGDVYLQSSSTVIQAKSNDPSGPGLRVSIDCQAHRGDRLDLAGAGVLYDTRVFVDVKSSLGSTSGDENDGYSDKKFMGIRNGVCPNAADEHYDAGHDAWVFYRDRFPLGASGQLSGGLLTLVHTERDYSGGINCHLEQAYFTREMGRVRHEAYYNSKYAECTNSSPLDDCNVPLNPPTNSDTETWQLYACVQYIYSDPPGGKDSDDKPQKAHDILEASNMTSVLWHSAQTPSDLPVLNSITPSTISWGFTGDIAITGWFPPNQWFGNHVKIMTASGRGGSFNTDSTLLGVSLWRAKFKETDWSATPLQCGGNDLGLFDGVSTSNNPVTLTVTGTPQHPC